MPRFHFWQKQASGISSVSCSPPLSTPHPYPLPFPPPSYSRALFMPNSAIDVDLLPAFLALLVVLPVRRPWRPVQVLHHPPLHNCGMRRGQASHEVLVVGYHHHRTLPALLNHQERKKKRFDGFRRWHNVCTKLTSSVSSPKKYATTLEKGKAKVFMKLDEASRRRSIGTLAITTPSTQDSTLNTHLSREPLR